jgi:predicted nucleic acid-binding Zn ribbon protein
MPTHTYRRDDGTTFEVQQKITDDPLRECPETGQPVERVSTRSPGVMLESEPGSGGPDDRTAPEPACPGPLRGL